MGPGTAATPVPSSVTSYDGPPRKKSKLRLAVAGPSAVGLNDKEYEQVLPEVGHEPAGGGGVSIPLKPGVRRKKVSVPGLLKLSPGAFCQVTPKLSVTVVPKLTFPKSIMAPLGGVNVIALARFYFEDDAGDQRTRGDQATYPPIHLELPKTMPAHGHALAVAAISKARTLPGPWSKINSKPVRTIHFLPVFGFSFAVRSC